MKRVLLTILAFLLAQSVFATVNGNDKVYLVVKNLDTEEFFLERAPIIGCYGLPRGPQLAQFTAEYNVNSNIGCGDYTFFENINYLSCAKLVEAKETKDFTSYTDITLNISQCEAKNNAQFITMVRTAAKLNFPLKKGEVNLRLIK